MGFLSKLADSGRFYQRGTPRSQEPTVVDEVRTGTYRLLADIFREIKVLRFRGL